jgi:hypothetical protein
MAASKGDALASRPFSLFLQHFFPLIIIKKKEKERVQGT